MSYSGEMGTTNWLRQTPDKAAFADLLWSQPQNKRSAGKLLIVGGNLHSFTAVSQSYASATKAGAGSVRVLLPDALQKSLGRLFPEADFAPSTPSGSFGRDALGQLLDSASWADMVLLAGDFGKNSETAILLDAFLKKYPKPLAICGDCIDYFYKDPLVVLDRPQTSVIAEFGQLQKLLSGRLLLKHSMDLMQIINALNEFSAICPAALVTTTADQVIVTAEGQASTTAAKDLDYSELSSYMAVWQMQQPDKIFKALTCAAYCLVKEPADQEK